MGWLGELFELRDFFIVCDAALDSSGHSIGPDFVPNWNLTAYILNINAIPISLVPNTTEGFSFNREKTLNNDNRSKTHTTGLL